MKKFTHIDEDLIKENLEVNNKFELGYNFSISRLETIKSALNNMAKEQVKNSGDYGYVGDINHVNESLNEILEFLVEYQNKYSAI